MWNDIKNIFSNLQTPIDTIKIKDIDCYTYNLNEKNDYIIIYLHGGAYLIRDISYYTILFKIAKKYNNISCIFLNYTLNDPKKNILEVKNVIEFLEKKCKKIILMGYSAGGHISLQYYVYANNFNLIKPYKMVLLSPWINPKEPLQNNRDIIPTILYNYVSNNIETNNISDYILDFKFCEIYLIYGEKDLLYDQINDSKKYINYSNEYICSNQGHCFLYLSSNKIIDNIIKNIYKFIVKN